MEGVVYPPVPYVQLFLIMQTLRALCSAHQFLTLPRALWVLHLARGRLRGSPHNCYGDIESSLMGSNSTTYHHMILKEVLFVWGQINTNTHEIAESVSPQNVLFYL